jgi:hypothetical protein
VRDSPLARSLAAVDQHLSLVGQDRRFPDPRRQLRICIDWADGHFIDGSQDPVGGL